MQRRRHGLVRAAFAGALLLGGRHGLMAQEAADTAAMRSAALEYLAGCPAGEALWGRSLCGPLIVVDPVSRTAVATLNPPAGDFLADGRLYFGRIPAGIPLANTAQEWGEMRWAFVLMPLPSEAFARQTLLFHESFHGVQPALGLNRPDYLNPHLDQRDGRYWLRLELRALAVAVRQRGAASRAAAGDALLFRAVRQRQYSGADTLESALELAEGLAEYTGVRMALPTGGASDTLMVESARRFEARPSYVRSLGYGTGPLLGLLLDRYRPDWRARIAGEGFGPQLAAALDWRPPREPERGARQRAGLYGGAAVAAEEDARATARRQVRDEYHRRLVVGPALVLRQKGVNLSFDPNTLLPLDSLGTVYPTGSFTAEWGRLEVTGGGALLSGDFSQLRVSLPEGVDLTGATVAAPGWRLALKPEWRVVPGGRPGEWTVAGPSPGRPDQ